MPKATHIYVTAPPGRKTPVDKSDGVEPNGSLLYVDPGEVRRVRYFLPNGSTSQTIRRSVNRGDLILCDMNGALVDSYELAAAPDAVADPLAPLARAKKEASK